MDISTLEFESVRSGQKRKTWQQSPQPKRRRAAGDIGGRLMEAGPGLCLERGNKR